LIDDQIYSNLRLLKDIRNAFAHTQELIHFETEEIIKLCQKLPGWKKGTDNHSLFITISKECVRTIDAKMQAIIFEPANANSYHNQSRRTSGAFPAGL